MALPAVIVRSDLGQDLARSFVMALGKVQRLLWTVVNLFVFPTVVEDLLVSVFLLEFTVIYFIMTLYGNC